MNKISHTNTIAAKSKQKAKAVLMSYVLFMMMHTFAMLQQILFSMLCLGVSVGL